MRTMVIVGRGLTGKGALRKQARGAGLQGSSKEGVESTMGGLQRSMGGLQNESPT